MHLKSPSFMFPITITICNYTGLFDKTSLGEGTTHKNHFPVPPATKGPNLRPGTGILLGAEKFVPRSCYRKHFDGIKQVYNVS